MRSFWLCFVPLFVAVDAIGVFPIFLQLTADLDAARRRRVILQSVTTALIVALVFLAGGRMLFNLLGITVADFMIAGGALLFAISIADILSIEKRRYSLEFETLGAVPIGVPLIVGPAVLTTILLLVDAHGRGMTLLAAALNIAIAGLVFWFAPGIYRILGNVGAKTASKLASLLLAAIAVMMMRRGMPAFFH